MKQQRIWTNIELLVHLITFYFSDKHNVFLCESLCDQQSKQLKGFADPGYFICPSRSVFWMTANTISQGIAFKHGCRKQPCKWCIALNQSTSDKYMFVNGKFHDVYIQNSFSDVGNCGWWVENVNMLRIVSLTAQICFVKVY